MVLHASSMHGIGQEHSTNSVVTILGYLDNGVEFNETECCAIPWGGAVSDKLFS